MPKAPSTESGAASEKMAAVFRATRELIGAHGFHGTPMAAIARRARVSVGTIYHHYAGKTELLNAVYLTLKQEVARTVLVDVPMTGPATERLQRLLEAVHAYHAEHPAEMSFMEQYERSPYILEDTHSRDPGNG